MAATNVFASMIQPSGGLRYHLRALRWNNRLWNGFRAGLAQWLAEEWNPPERKLILIGPSGGYCLPLPWIASRFEEVRLYDTDVLALRIFQSRFRPRRRSRPHPHPHPRPAQAPPPHISNVVLKRMNVFPHLKTDVFKNILDDHPDHAVLFCNLLGQFHLAIGDTAEEESRLKDFQRHLGVALSGAGAPLPGDATPTGNATPFTAAPRCSWASFHDRLSGSLKPLLTPQNSRQPHALNNAELVATFYEDRPRIRSIELIDHLTEGLFDTAVAPATPRRYLAWELAPRNHHLIECVNVNRPNSAELS